MGHDANYIEERVLQPLQRAVALMREADKLEATIKQRQDTVSELQKGEADLKRKQADWAALIEANKANAATQRQETQALIQADRTTREAERMQFQRECEALRVQQQAEQDRLADLKRERQAAEAELAAIKQDIATRLDSLRKVAQ